MTSGSYGGVDARKSALPVKDYNFVKYRILRVNSTQLV